MQYVLLVVFIDRNSDTGLIDAGVIKTGYRKSMNWSLGKEIAPVKRGLGKLGKSISMQLILGNWYWGN